MKTARYLPSLIFFVVLFGLLLGVYYPSFLDPPRSDHWTVLYYFHQYQKLPFLERIMHIANYDIWGHGTYRPLFHLALYGLHFLFGSNYILYHVANFGLYFLNLILLYRLATALGCARSWSAAFLTVFAFLFSHFDIVAWVFHIAIIAGFTCFLAGFLIYLQFLKSGRAKLLIPVGVFFLIGIWCYESYLLWPLGLILLRPASAPEGSAGSVRKRWWRWPALALIILYLLYAGLFVFSRSFTSGAFTASAAKLLSPIRFFSSMVTAMADAFYNGVLVNAFPRLACPVLIQYNVDLGGALLQFSPELGNILFLRSATVRGGGWVAPPVIITEGMDLDTFWRSGVPPFEMTAFIVGSVAVVALIWFVIWFSRRDKNALSRRSLFLLYLLITELAVLFHARSVTNMPLYLFRQFRYQYVSNALVMLSILCVISRSFRASRKSKAVAFPLLAVILLMNLSLVRVHVGIISEQMAPLHVALWRIRSDIKNGRLAPAGKMYLDDSFAQSLPPLCWNRDMEKYVKGTYQWLFTPREIGVFSSTPENARWILRKLPGKD